MGDLQSLGTFLKIEDNSFKLAAVLVKWGPLWGHFLKSLNIEMSGQCWKEGTLMTSGDICGK